MIDNTGPSQIKSVWTANNTHTYPLEATCLQKTNKNHTLKLSALQWGNLIRLEGTRDKSFLIIKSTPNVRFSQQP